MNSVVPTKKMEASNPANPESGEAHNQPEETGTEHVISISDSFQERLRTLDSDASVKEEDKGHKPLIGQVPLFLGMESELEKYFQPLIMSIGPVHNDKDKFKQGQQFKKQLTKSFVEHSRGSSEVLYNNILKEIESFKQCYDQQKLQNKFNDDDQELAWMFFVDGCALIEFIQRYVWFRWFSFNDMNIASDQIIKLVVTDLMLVDNQLPLGVLRLVMEFSKEEEFLMGMGIRLFTKEIIEISFEGWAKDEKADGAIDQSFNKENHLLELIWMNFVKKEKDNRSDTIEATPLVFFVKILSVLHVLIKQLGLLVSRKPSPRRKLTSYYSPYNTGATSQHFRNVKDLQAAGIILERNNSSSSLRDISFNWGIFFCKLKIPSFHVSEHGKSLVFNLIAFEMHPSFNGDRVVTSYISFLNSLIATKEDVAELQKAGILFNHLPNEQEVIKTFRELTSSLKPHPDIFYNTKIDLIKYFNDKKSMTTGKWLSEAMQVYFRSPWTTIAVISATFLLILTVIQTILSVLAHQRRETICDFIPENFNANCGEWLTSIFNASLNFRKNG